MSYNKTELTKILEELYLLDPELKKIPGLEKKIQHLLEQKKHITIDLGFAQKLKDQVLEAHESQYAQTSIIQLLTSYMKQPLYIAGTGTVAIVAIVAIGMYTFQQNPSGILPIDQHLFAKQITQQPERSFGPLSGLQIQEMQTGPVSATRIETEFGASSDLATETMIGTTEPARLIAPFPSYRTTYSYQGESFEIPTDLPIYRRTTNLSQAKSLAQAFNGNKSGILNIGGSHYIENLTLVGSGSNAMTINLNFEYGEASLYASPDQEREREIMYQRNPGKVTVLGDEELIAIAQQALEKYGVDVQSFGEPVVDKRWQSYQGENGDTYVPDMQTVIFPTQFNGQIVYEQDGSIASGITVSVDQRTRNVSSIWNLKTQQYESSNYSLVSDTTRLNNLATRGGFMNVRYEDENAEVFELTLGTPEIIYIQYTRYNEKREELYMPALRYPVIASELPEDLPYYMGTHEYVTVPLVSDIVTELEERENDIILPVESVPLPLLLRDAENES